MTTPIYDYLEKYKNDAVMRMHMPGHKGRNTGNRFSAVYEYDITEISGADSLYEARGIIAESERNAADIFGTVATFYSTQGSTLGIQTMLTVAAPSGSTVVAPRNAHRAFLHTCALLDLDVEWVIPAGNFNAVSFEYTASDIERAIKKAENPSCVYLTSPDYFGRIADIKGISEVCRKYDIPLLVDNAHGAHLAFMEKNMHPIANGADMCCDSAHKMLPVLTGGGYIHIGNEKYLTGVKRAMAIYGSSSPSYLTLCSLDLCNDYLEKSVRADIEEMTENINALRRQLSPAWRFVEGEPFHFTIDASSSGLSGRTVAQILRENGVECEYEEDEYVVLLFSPIDTAGECQRISDILSNVRQPKMRIEPQLIALKPPATAMSVREASFSVNERINIDNAKGRICGISETHCPPCIPIAAPGEVIDENIINILKKYSIFEINVVK